MNPIFKVSSLAGLHDAAEEIARLIEEGGYRLLLLSGTMGAGKTTLVREICSVWGVRDDVTSPTFALINEYSDDAGNPIYHFDIYRINSIDEVLDLGYEEYFYSGNICFVEWHEKMSPLLPEKSDSTLRMAEIRITATDQEERIIEFIER